MDSAPITLDCCIFNLMLTVDFQSMLVPCYGGILVMPMFLVVRARKFLDRENKKMSI